MKIGIVGLPNAGKSSLFNLLTKANAQVAKFPFTTIDRNVGMVMVRDERFDRIIEVLKPAKATPAAIEFVDIAGLIKGASRGEGLGNQFLSHIRDVDIIVHLLRCFEAADIPLGHSEMQIDPLRDYDIVRTELMLADLDLVERRLDKIKKKFEVKEEFDKLTKIKEFLAKGRVPQSTIPDLPLLTTKQEIIVLNLDEDGAFQTPIQGYRLSVKLEEDICDFDEKEKIELRANSKLEPGALYGLVKLCMEKLSVISFYTIKGEETRAWIIKKGTKVIDAAGMIHTDLKEGFIKAEILDFDGFVKDGGFTQAQHLGHTKIEGKEYVVKDGDIILIKFRI